MQGKLQALAGTFTKTEELIAEYILHYPENARKETSHQVAQKLDIGQSSIIRFAQKLGYRGFRDMQLDIEVSEEPIVDEISESESTELTNHKIVNQYKDIAELTLSLNDPQTIDEAIRLIISARNIVAFGVGNSGLFAEYLANQLIKMGIIVLCSDNYHNLYSAALNFGLKDLIIIVSESGQSREAIKLAMIAKNNRIPIIAITRLASNRLSQIADVVLKTSNKLTGTRLNAMTIRSSQLILIDMICLNIYKTDFKKFLKIVETTERYREDDY